MRAAWCSCVLAAVLAGCGQGADSGASAKPDAPGSPGAGTGLTGSFPPASATAGGMGAAPAAPPQGRPDTTPGNAMGKR